MKKSLCALFALLLVGCALRADEKPKAATLTAQEIADGWIMLFDGETTFGWKIDGEAKVKDAALVLGGEKATTATVTTEFASRFDYSFKCRRVTAGDLMPTLILGGRGGGNMQKLSDLAEQQGSQRIQPEGRATVELRIPAGGSLELLGFKIRPDTPTALFNGKDLSGWKQFTGDPTREKSKFSVTSEGWLNVKDGPGDLQTERQFADFVLQAECISNGEHLNSGIFFRALPGQYQQGYEAQIHNGFLDGDRTKPKDYGTGAIYRRVKARKVVPNDHEWFTMTVVAHGNHIATWVNGYQTTDFTDDRPANDNARNGSKTAAGAISIQGHDKTTDLSFRNIRIAELPKNK